MSETLVRLYGVATDYEMAVLDELCERAGIRWTCSGSSETHNHPWTNPEGEPCELCGRTKEEEEAL